MSTHYDIDITKLKEHCVYLMNEVIKKDNLAISYGKFDNRTVKDLEIICHGDGSIYFCFICDENKHLSSHLFNIYDINGSVDNNDLIDNWKKLAIDYFIVNIEITKFYWNFE